MSTTRNVAVIVGSLRKESFNRKMANALIAMAPAPLKLDDPRDRPAAALQPGLRGATRPPAVTRIQATRFAAADAVLFVTPEYNRSVPGVLKNAIDVGSRPYGKSSWSGKPGAVISVSPGAIGAFGANHALRQSLVFLDVPAMPQPEAYIGNAGGAVRRQGRAHQRIDARVHAEIPAGVRAVDRAQRAALNADVARASAGELADHRERLVDRAIAVARLAPRAARSRAGDARAAAARARRAPTARR